MTSIRAELCRSERCRAAIFWAMTPDNKLMPIDLEETGDGTVIIADRINPVTGVPWIERIETQLSMLMGEERRYTSHFVTCPDRDKFRKS